MAEYTQLIVCTFDGEAQADEARRAIHALDQQIHALQNGNIAVVSKGSDGLISFWETENADAARRSAMFGVATGWLLGECVNVALFMFFALRSLRRPRRLDAPYAA